MPRNDERLLRTLAPIALVALAAAGCTAEPPETTDLYEVLTGPSDDPWCGPADDGRLLEDGADLVGPHFSISMLCHYSGTAVPEHVLESTEELVGLPQPAEGAEFLVNQIALGPTYEPSAVGGTVSAWVEAGKERIDLGTLPLAGGYLVVSVPEGEDAVLWVEDDGRAQGLDFRTGAQVDPVAAYYDGAGVQTVEVDGYAYEEIRILNDESAYRLKCVNGSAEVERRPWLEEHDWAPDGTVFVSVVLEWCDAFDDVVHWQLDQEAALTVDGGGDAVPAFAWDEAAGDDWTVVTALFEVPAEAVDLTVDFTPVGELKNLGDGQGFAFEETPETTEWAVSF